MSTMSRVFACAVACSAMIGTARAQTDIRSDEWSRGTTLSGSAGVAVGSAQSGPAFGGAVGWELTSRFTIEGSGSWQHFGGGANAFAGALKLRSRLLGRRTIDPFVQGGVGLYRAWFDADASAMPRFYHRRLGSMASIQGTGATFTDPSLVAGGGLNIFVNRHVAIRPDVETAFVIRTRRTHVVTSIAVQAVYHFEEHPVTPSRR